MNLKEDLRTSLKMNINIQIFLKSKFLRYLMVGGFSTTIHILIASLYLRFVTPSIFYSNTLGFLSAYVFSYIMQSKLVFQRYITMNNAIKYFTVQFCGLMFTIFATTYIQFENAYVQTVTVAVILACISFFVHPFWTFKRKAS
jgi:putative flippase GtrA